jgi:cytochrome c oxidase subunit I+III
VVAHFHYVLIGGVTFPIFAALYYWMPMFSARMMNERLGRWNFWLVFIGFHTAFFPMHIVGLLGMPRRVYTYQEGIGWDIYNQISTIGAFILALGVLLFLINLFTSLRSGERAAPNPWKADSLEWATGLPAPNYGFAELPIVRSRHPLWDQEDLREGDARTMSLLKDLSGWPLTWRAALTSSVLEGRPTEIFRVSGPSIWPFVTAVGLITMFAAEIFTLRILVLSGLGLLLVGLVGWHWPNRIEMTERELEFERTHNIQVYPNGSPVVTRWSMALMILLVGICVSLFEFTYFYIAILHVEWPQDNLPAPELLLPGIATLAMLAAAGSMFFANRRISAGRQWGLRIFLLLAFVLGGTAAGLLVYDLRQVPFDHTTNVYGSLYVTLSIFLVAIVIGGMAQNLFTQVWAWRGRYTPREHIAVDIGALYWYFAALFWVILAGTVYLSPHLM